MKLDQFATPVEILNMIISENEVNGSTNTPSICTEHTDIELLMLIGVNRDPTALTMLYNRYRLTLRPFLQRHLYEAKLVDECYNDVMLTVWQKANNFRGESKVSTWIFSIAYRTQIAASIKENRHRHVDSEAAKDRVASQKQAEIDTQADANQTLHAALARLPKKHLSVIELSYFHGYSVIEISEIVGCPENTVKSRLFDGRKKLKAAIEADAAAQKHIHGGPANVSNNQSRLGIDRQPPPLID